MAVREYAITKGHLAALCAELRLPYEEAVAHRMVEMAVKQIALSVEGRGETSYSLVQPSGETNTVRVSSVHRYLRKIVERQLSKREGGSAPVSK